MHSNPGGMVFLRANARLPRLLGAAVAASVRQHTLWRFRVIDFPSACSRDAPISACAARCNTDLYTMEQIGCVRASSRETVIESMTECRDTATRWQQIGCVRVAEHCHGVSRHGYTMAADRVCVLGGWDGSRLSNIAQHVGATHLARPLQFTT